MHLLKTIIVGCLSPVGLVILLFAGGLGLSLLRRNLRLKNAFLVAGASLYLFFTFSPLAEIAIGSLERAFPPVQMTGSNRNVEAIVVLPSYGEENSTTPITSNLSDDTIGRLVEGIRLYRQDPRVKLLMSGGILKKGDPAIAALMADFAKAMGVPGEDIQVEGDSRDTYESSLEVRRILGDKHFFLVTSGYHLRRAMAIAKKLQMHAIAAPAQIWTLQHFPPDMSWTAWSLQVLESFSTPSQYRLIYLQRASHEYVGYLWYWIKGRI